MIEATTDIRYAFGGASAPETDSTEADTVAAVIARDALDMVRLERASQQIGTNAGEGISVSPVENRNCQDQIASTHPNVRFELVV